MIDQSLISDECNLSVEEMNQLEQWTELTCEAVIFDSDIDDWSKGTSVFNSRIENRSQLMFVVEDEKNNKFGYYFNARVLPHSLQGNGWTGADEKTFVFSLKSNGRINGMKKFEIRDIRYGIFGCSNGDACLISLGRGTDIGLMKKHSKSSCWCNQECSNFNYEGINTGLCGPNPMETNFTPKRITVIQMK